MLHEVARRSRQVATGILTAVVVGLVLGAAARALMRLVTVAAGQPGHFSWGGTAGIVAVYVLAALPGCVLAALTRRRGRSLLLVAGALFLCVPATGVASEEVTAESLSAWQWAGVLAAGAGVYATILAGPVLALGVLDRVLPREAPRVAVRVPGPRSGRTSSRTGQRGSRPVRP